VAVYLALPLFTNHMPQEEYGVVSVLAALLAFASTLSSAGLPAATFRLYNDSQDVKVRRLTLGSAQMLMTLYALVMALVMLVGAAPLSQWLLDDAAYAPIVRIVAVLLFIETLSYYGNILLRVQVRPLTSSLRGLFHVAAQLGLALILVRGYDLGARGYWLGYLGGAVLGLGLMLWLVRDALVFQVSRQRMMEMIAYGLPLLPATLSLWALRLVDRSLVVSLAGLNEVAVYEVGTKVGTLAALALATFRVAWPQFAFSAMHKPSAPRVYRDSLTYVATGCAFAAVGVIVFNADLVQIMAPPAYAGAVSVVPWVALSQIAWGMYPVLAIGLHIAKRTRHIAAVTVLSAALNIVLNVVLIPRMGIQGAAIATVVGYTALAAGVYVVGRRFYAFPIDWARMAKLALAGGLTIFLAVRLGHLDASLWGGRALRAAGLLLYPFFLLLTGFVTLNQVRVLWQTGTGLLSTRLKRTRLVGN
jgi:O-antigen/teichoic acid export membrane protein